MTTFSARRFLYFLRFECGILRGKLLMPLLLPPLLFTAFALSRLAFGIKIDEWGETSYLLGLMLALNAAANAFRRELEPESASVHLLLPASHLERFLVRWCLSFLLAFGMQLIILVALSNLFAFAQASATQQTLTTWLAPDFAAIQRIFRNFILMHAIFFTGGLYFRKNPVLKSIFAMHGYVAILALVGGLISYAGYKVFRSEGMSMVHSILGAVAKDAPLSSPAVYLSWYVLFPALLYLCAFFRSQEIEANG